MPSLLSRAAHFVQKKMGLFDQRYRDTMYGCEFLIPMINGRKTYASENWMTEIIP